MDDKKFLLITTPSETVFSSRDINSEPLLSLGYLAASLRDKGFCVEIFDPKHQGLDFKKSLKRIIEINPDVVGITSLTHEINTANKLAASLKEWKKDIVVIIGGPHASALPAKTLEEFNNFDFLVRQEGEATLVELASYLTAKGIPLDKIKGISYRKERIFLLNAARQKMIVWIIFS